MSRRQSKLLTAFATNHQTAVGIDASCTRGLFFQWRRLRSCSEMSIRMFVKIPDGLIAVMFCGAEEELINGYGDSPDPAGRFR